jgi:hypothetical protein
MIYRNIIKILILPLFLLFFGDFMGEKECFQWTEFRLSETNSNVY